MYVSCGEDDAMRISNNDSKMDNQFVLQLLKLVRSVFGSEGVRRAVHRSEDVLIM